MKKLLGTTLALAMFMPAGANAELLKNLKVGGQLDIQTTSSRNTADFVTRPHSDTDQGGGDADRTNNDRIGSAQTRLIVNTDWDLLDDVHARVAFVKGSQSNGAAGNRAYGSGAESADQWMQRTWINEANVKIDKVMGLLDITAGRQTYGEEGDLVIYFGPRNNFGQTMTALDIFRADWNGEHMTVTGIAGKTAGGTNGLAPLDTDLRGLAVSCKMHEMIKPSAYVYNQVTRRANPGTGVADGLGSQSGKNDFLWVAGIKAKVTAGGLAASLEFAKNFGANRPTRLAPAVNGAQAQMTNYKGYAIQAKAGYKLDLSNVAMINPWGEIGLGTGDSNFGSNGNNTFTSIATDYRPGGIYGRFDQGAALVLGANSGHITNPYQGASNGLSNRYIWGFGVKATPAAISKLTTGIAFYRYQFHRVAPNAQGNKTSLNIGAEVDLTGEWKHSENVSFKVTGGVFRPGAYAKDTGPIAHISGNSGTSLNPVAMAAGDVSIKF